VRAIERQKALCRFDRLFDPLIPRLRLQLLLECADGMHAQVLSPLGEPALEGFLVDEDPIQ
jgi:hypothetical protein